VKPAPAANTTSAITPAFDLKKDGLSSEDLSALLLVPCARATVTGVTAAACLTNIVSVGLGFSESGVAAGVRRIEAVTGEQALGHIDNLQNRLRQVAQLVKGDRNTVADKVRQLVDKNRRLEKELEQLKHKLASGQGSDLFGQAIEVAGVKILAVRLDGADAKTLRETLDRLKDKLKTAVVVLAAVEDDKVRLVAGVTPDQTNRIQAGELVNMVAQQVGGKGGGRADMAQAGGTDPSRLEAALHTVPDWVKNRLL